MFESNSTAQGILRKEHSLPEGLSEEQAERRSPAREQGGPCVKARLVVSAEPSRPCQDRGQSQPVRSAQRMTGSGSSFENKSTADFRGNAPLGIFFISSPFQDRSATIKRIKNKAREGERHKDKKNRGDK